MQQAPPPQPPHRQALQPLQPLQPRQPPHRQPQASWVALRAAPAFSLSKRWNVAKLTSAISSSPSVMAWLGEKLLVCWMSVGTADADAPPASEKLNPAAPSAGRAALVTRFRFEACFTRGIVASSIPVREFLIQSVAIVRLANVPRKTDGTHDHATNDEWESIQHSFILMNDASTFYASTMSMIDLFHDNLNAPSALSRGDGF